LNVTYIFEADGIPYLFFKHDAKSGLLPAKEARKSPLRKVYRLMWSGSN